MSVVLAILLLLVSSPTSLEPLQQNTDNPPSNPLDRTQQQRPRHLIRGRIRQPSGREIDRNIRFILRRSTHEIIGEGYTDGMGFFELKDLPNGTYELVVEADEQYETTIERIELYYDRDAIETRDVYLRPKEHHVARHPRSGVISAAELQKNIPKSARREYQRGVEASAKGQREKAIQHLQRALELHADFTQARNDLGVQYLRMGRLQEAYTEFLRAVSSQPTLPEPYINLGYLLTQQHEYRAALVHLDRALQLAPTHWQALTWTGVSLMQTGELDRAEQCLKKAIELSFPPEGAFVHLYLANLYLRKGNKHQALAHAEAYLNELPNAPDAQEVRRKIEQIRAR
ncbi:MAG: tetratricopeptide repeat protein [Acidobacteriota bacterium]|nr:tetratricopeptide repeat protein [Blastocatellia bacterium]MDW8239642.1 tetratricopeptide repeat protein [Acidobacteriota bacterium]